MNKDVLIIFMRTPVKGIVKSRLAAETGEDLALEVYLELLSHSREIAMTSGFDCYLFHTGDHPSLEAWPSPPFDLFTQEGKDLGERMKNGFRLAFNHGAKKAVIIGTDCYELTPGILKTAFRALNDHDLVVGPATDGGYYLLGMTRLHEQLFTGKKWGTSSVLEDTLSDAGRLNLQLKKLIPLNDIDTLQDLQNSSLAKKYNSILS